MNADPSSVISSEVDDDGKHQGSVAPKKPGLIGLQNLGNTCFLNSAVQALSHCPSLARYFLESKFKDEVNMSNPLGHKGAVAEVFAQVLERLWNENPTEVDVQLLKKMKDTVASFAPQFAGYAQQDAQEFLSFLLDGLHEDLNRVKAKPMVPRVVSDGQRPDAEVARDSWNAHRVRNSSVVVDLFHGLYKSTLVCPKCVKTEVSFDPFVFLSVPLPSQWERGLEVTVHRRLETTASLPVRYCPTVARDGTLKDLLVAVAKLANLSPDVLVMAEIHSNRIFNFLPPTKPLKEIADHDVLYAYEVLPLEQPKAVVAGATSSAGPPPPPKMKGPPPAPGKGKAPPPLKELIHLKVIHRRLEKETAEAPTADTSATPQEGQEVKTTKGSKKPFKTPLFGTPLLLSVNPKKTSNRDLHALIHTAVSRWCKSSEKKFTLRVTNNTGTNCARCAASSPCIGCVIPDDEAPMEGISDTQALAVDWDAEEVANVINAEEEQRVQIDSTVTQHREKGMQRVPLSECLDLFTQKEQLRQEDAWYCPHCKDHVLATKKIDLWQLPDFLIVHLKRFQNRSWKEKLDTFVDYPLEGLDLSPYVINTEVVGKCTYDLVAVINHSGASGVGHYTNFCRNEEDNQWYSFNDITCRRSEQVRSPLAYCLFYRKRK